LSGKAITFSRPSFFAAFTSAVIEVGPVLVRCVTFAQLTDGEAPAEDDVADTPTATMLDIVAAANNAALNFRYATCATSLISNRRSGDSGPDYPLVARRAGRMFDYTKI
jgi:hypothetical protein